MYEHARIVLNGHHDGHLLKNCACVDFTKRANVNFDYINGILSNFRIYDQVIEVPVALDTLK